MTKLTGVILGLIGFAGGTAFGMLLAISSGPSFSEIAEQRTQLEHSNRALAANIDALETENRGLQRQLTSLREEVDTAVDFFEKSESQLKVALKHARERAATLEQELARLQASQADDAPDDD